MNHTPNDNGPSRIGLSRLEIDVLHEAMKYTLTSLGRPLDEGVVLTEEGTRHHGELTRMAFIISQKLKAPNPSFEDIEVFTMQMGLEVLRKKCVAILEDPIALSGEDAPAIESLRLIMDTCRKLKETFDRIRGEKMQLSEPINLDPRFFKKETA